MKSKIPFTVSTLAATLLSTFAAFAQETTLDTVTVTSTTIDDRFAGRRGEVSSTTTINGSQVDERRPQNIINVLQSIPGITVLKASRSSRAEPLTCSVKMHFPVLWLSPPNVVQNMQE